jgi:hypothetical protein
MGYGIAKNSKIIRHENIINSTYLRSILPRNLHLNIEDVYLKPNPDNNERDNARSTSHLLGARARENIGMYISILYGNGMEKICPIKLKLVTPFTCKIGPRERTKNTTADIAQNFISVVLTFKIATNDKKITVYPTKTEYSVIPPPKLAEIGFTKFLKSGWRSVGIKKLNKSGEYSENPPAYI